MTFERTNADGSIFQAIEFPTIQFIKFNELNKFVRFNVLFKDVVVAEFSMDFSVRPESIADKQHSAIRAIPKFVEFCYGYPSPKVEIVNKRYDNPPLSGAWPSLSNYVVGKPWNAKIQARVEYGPAKFLVNLYMQNYEDERLTNYVEYTLKSIFQELHFQFSRVHGIVYGVKGVLI